MMFFFFFDVYLCMFCCHLFIMSVAKNTTDTSLYDVFERLYADPSVGGVGKDRFARALRRKEIKFTTRQLNDWWSKHSDIGEIHKPVKKADLLKKMKTIHVPRVGYIQADLMFFERYGRFNGGFKYLLTCMDTYSRKAFAIPLKTKETGPVQAAMNVIISYFQQSGYHVYTITTDPGAEFNRQFITNMGKQGIDIYQDKPGYHSRSAIIERFNLTVRNTINRLITANGTYKWVDWISDIVHNYNNSPHRALSEYMDITPNTIWNRNKIPDTEQYAEKDRSFYQQLEQLQPGDFVRILEKKPKVGRLTNTYSREMYRVQQLAGGYEFKLQNMDGTSKDGLYYLWELQKVAPKEQRAPPSKQHAPRIIEQVPESDISAEQRRQRFLRREGIDESNIIT